MRPTVCGAKAGQHIRNRTRLNDYGFTIGGPALLPKLYDGRDRTFFFNFEQWRNVQFTGNSIITVPTAAMRGGDFSRTDIPSPRLIASTPREVSEGTIYDPATEFLENGERIRLPFAGNIIPMNRLDPVAAKIQNYFPLPTNDNLLFNYAIPIYSVPRQQTLPSVKIDHNLNPTIKLSGYWGLNMTRSPGGDGLPEPITTRQTTNDTAHTIRINYDHSLTPTPLLHLGAGLAHFSSSPEVVDFDSRTQLGLLGQNRTYFPWLTGLSAGARGGWSPGVGVGTKLSIVNTKPTAKRQPDVGEEQPHLQIRRRDDHRRVSGRAKRIPMRGSPSVPIRRRSRSCWAVRAWWRSRATTTRAFSWAT